MDDVLKIFWRIIISLFSAVTFVFLTCFFVSFFTYFPRGYHLFTDEKDVSLIFQKDDKELLSENYESEIGELRDIRFININASDFVKSSVLGLPLDWIHHISCFEWFGSLSASGIPVPIVLLIKKQVPGGILQIPYRERTCIDTDDYNFFEFKPEYRDHPSYKKFISDRRTRVDILRNCEVDQSKPNHCIVSAKINMNITTNISNRKSLVAAYILAATLSILLLTAILPKIVKFIRNGITEE